MNKNFVIATALAVFMTAALYSFPAAKTNEDISQLAFHSAVCMYKNNELIGPCSHNTMMTTGLNFVRNLIGNWTGGVTPVKYIAVGNGSTAESAALTTLDSEIAECDLERAEGAYVSIGNGNWSISKEFTSSCNSLLVNSTALFNASTSGTMFAGKDFANSVTLQSGDKLNVTWYIWVS